MTLNYQGTSFNPKIYATLLAITLTEGVNINRNIII